MINALNRLFTSIAAIGVAVFAVAQEHPYIASYELTPFDGAIRVQWVMHGGNTCDGLEVERSTDGVLFTTVHRIQGICGDPTVAVPFEWLDEAPPEFSVLHYRIKMGFTGFSSVKSVVFTQLTTSEQRFFPSPTNGTATLLLNLPQGAPIDLVVLDHAGRVVLQQQALRGPVLTLDLHALKTGVYVYQATSEGRVFTGRFVRAL